MVCADESVDDDTGLTERIPPSVPRTVLNDGVARPKFPGGAVIEFEHAAAGNDVLVINCGGRMHSRMIWFKRFAKAWKLFIQFADGRLHVEIVRDRGTVGRKREQPERKPPTGGK